MLFIKAVCLSEKLSSIDFTPSTVLITRFISPDNIISTMLGLPSYTFLTFLQEISFSLRKFDVPNVPTILKPSSINFLERVIIFVLSSSLTDIKTVPFLGNLTFAPIDKDLIDERMLTNNERNYLFNYHLETYSKISPFLNKKQKKWLAKLI